GGARVGAAAGGRRLGRGRRRPGGLLAAGVVPVVPGQHAPADGSGVRIAMTTYAPPPARPSGPPPPRDTRPPSREPTHGLPGHAAWTGSIVAPVAAGAATLCAATALTGVIRGAEWFGHAMVAVVLVGCTGLAMRSIRAPALAVSFAQPVALLLLITGLYTSHGIL